MTVVLRNDTGLASQRLPTSLLYLVRPQITSMGIFTCTAGIRVDPPTRMTSLMSGSFKFASLSACMHPDRDQQAARLPDALGWWATTPAGSDSPSPGKAGTCKFAVQLPPSYHRLSYHKCKGTCCWHLTLRISSACRIAAGIPASVRTLGTQRSKKDKKMAQHAPAPRARGSDPAGRCTGPRT